MISYYKIKIHYYDPNALINKLNELKVLTYNLNIKDDVVSFECSIKDYQIIKNNFKNFQKELGGLRAGLNKYVFNFFSFLSLIIFILSFIIYHNLVINVYVQGDNLILEDKLKEELIDYDIKKYQRIKSFKEIKEIENNLKDKYFKSISYLSLIRIGNNIYLNFKIKENNFNLTKDNLSIVASKEGVICSYEVSRGIIKVKKNQYVNKGDLLIDGYYNDIYLGASGNVYALRYETFKEKVFNINNKLEAFLILKDKIYQKLEEIIDDDEKIINGKLIEFNYTYSVSELKMYYLLKENITK